MERLLIFAVVAVLGWLGYELLRRWQVQRVATAAPHDPLLAHMQPGVPTILYFTTPTCGPCQAHQRPALNNLLGELGDGRLQIVEVDAMADPDAASRWGVMSVPTTFILDRQGRPREVNHGVAGVEKLRRQVQGVA